jgi:AAA domain, putative AbiEii toxin, Type IV TA system/AAA ATPase domain
MIHKLTLKNFKSIREQSYCFTDFDLLVGRNNSGKSTVLQALAIWQFCVEEFARAQRKGNGTNGIQVILPNFTALPVPEFRLLWKDQAVGQGRTEKKGSQKLILIEIIVHWRDVDNKNHEFGIGLRYQTSQTIYAIPTGGWAAFRACEKSSNFPKIAYVPPFSGLEPVEKESAIGPIRQQVGKGQPGSVLRNLLLRVWRPIDDFEVVGVAKDKPMPNDWAEVAGVVKRWFSVDLIPPQYDKLKDVHIRVEYKENGKAYDLIAGGSGFHQTMTLLAFLYGYSPTTILLDEPDAHLHVNLQREIVDYFKKKSAEKGVQFLIATHAEEFANAVDTSQILSLLKQVPTRVESTPQVLRAMAEVSNEQITALLSSPYIVYVEGESDERILRAWAQQCGAQTVLKNVFFKTMDGGDKNTMRRLAKEHFAALQQIVPGVKHLMLFDYDSAENAFHDIAAIPSLAEWRRKNIENYLLVPPAWKRAALQALQVTNFDLLTNHVESSIDQFFTSENLTLPVGKTWRNVSANVFQAVDGKRMLFSDDVALFHKLRNGDPKIELLRDRVAAAMTADEIHEDVHQFFAKLIAMTQVS